MKKDHQRTLDFIELKRKILMVLLAVGFLTGLVFLMKFYVAEKKTTMFLNGKVINANAALAKSIVKSCVVELNDGRVVIAACNNVSMSDQGASVKIMSVIDKNNRVTYSVVR